MVGTHDKTPKYPEIPRKPPESPRKPQKATESREIHWLLRNLHERTAIVAVTMPPSYSNVLFSVLHG
jgi:hypothetical protein